MSNRSKNRLRSIFAMLLSVIMVIGSFPLSVFAAEVITQGMWTIENDTASGIASYGDMGFTYHSPTTTITYGSSGGKDYVRSNNTNGSASNGIVVTNNKSYCDFIPSNDGTLTVYVGNASSKQGYVSRSDKNGVSEAVGTFVPGGSDNYNSAGFEVVQGSTWATVNIEVEKGYTYYITLVGSKMFCYGAEFVAYTHVSGKINDSFNLDSYNIKFSNKETGEIKQANVSGNTYSILLKPGYQYSASLSGKNAIGYSFTNDTRIVNVEKAENQTADLTIEESISYLVTGTLNGISGDLPSDIKIIFVPEDTASYENVTADIDKENMTYSAQLVANENYTLKLEGAKDYKLAGDIKINNNDSSSINQNIEFTAVETFAVTGKFLGLTQIRGKYETLNVNPDSISFKNVDDEYNYTGNISNGTYNVNLRNGSYLASIVSDNYSTSTHVVVNNGAVTRDLLLKDISAKNIEYRDTLYVGDDKEYKSVQSAVDAAGKMTRTSGERVTIMIDPGTYREQVVVNTPDITLESNGGTRDNTEITWYYGIGYKYYSCVNNCYDPYADYDKFEKGNVVKHWGSAVIINAAATGFKAKNIGFENSFNKYMTSEEITDGAEPNGLEAIKVERKETTNVDTRTATERAAALVNYADKTEFNKCSFIGSQDTLYTSNKSAFFSYYKNCYIEGQTDFIYGTGDVIFDGCEINFCGYDGTEAAGYITANSSSDTDLAKVGYVFRSCYISYDNKRDTTPGYLGRMWGNSAKAAFINTQLQERDMIVGAGWYAMTVDPSVSTVTLREYNTTYNGEKIDTSERVNGVVDNIDANKYSVENTFVNNGWTPVYYTGDSINVPQFSSDPTMTSNGDLNTPNPGETITLGYELGNEWNDEDASRISWYAVNEGYDETSLDKILENSVLLKTSSAVSTNKFQIPMECAGKYIMAVITPITNSGLVGEAKYIIDKEKPVSNTWSDPDNEGSIAPGSGINIYLAGDSTVKDYSANGIYNGGKTLDSGSWGEFLQNFFDERYVTVNNYAQGGRSSRSFINEGKLDTIAANIKEGDYLFVQFGHNDCANGASYYEERFAPLYTKDNPKTENGYPTIVPNESMKVATPNALKNSYGNTYYSWDCGATYKGYLQQYINVALEKGAIPVIVSPVSRLYYNSDGTIKAHHDANMTDYAPTSDYLTTNNAYVTACEELYNENKSKGVLYIDAFNLTKSVYEEAYKADGNSNNGTAVMAKSDSTHSNKTGGIIQAGLLAKWIQDAGISVSPYVVQPQTVYGENSDGKYIFTIVKSKFTAKDNNYNENNYWSAYGQNLFDSISGSIASVNLNFASDEALALYETNADSSFVDGVYTGVYTNEDNQKFNASVYKSGIAYYNSQSKYGTKATVGKPILSFEAVGAGNYTISVTASTGNGTVNLYSDLECTNSVASGEGSIVYTKSTDDTEVLYFGASVSNNMYISNITISKVDIPVIKEDKVLLNFASDEALKLYETDAATTYIDGVYSGKYTNDSGQKFDVSVYENGIQYYNSQAQYGTKASVGKPVFSFAASEKAMYTIDITAGTGNGTISLYSDPECQNSVVSGSVPGKIVYKKTNTTPETLYVAASVANNLYMAGATIVKEELPLDVKVKFTGEIAGIEPDDTNVEITLKGSTETLSIKADEYEKNGIELIVGENYTVTAKGDKGIYLGTDIVTDNSGIANLVLSRIIFEFPLDFMEYYDDYKKYLEAMNYGDTEITDPYSGITVYPAGIVMTDAYKQFGVKTNANNIISFEAKQTGSCTVSFNTSVSNADKIILKVNDSYAPNLTTAVQGESIQLTVMVNKGDKVTIYTPTRSNLWYKSIDVSYADASFIQTEAQLNNDKSEAVIFGAVPKNFVGNIESAGFYYTTGVVGDLAQCVVADETDIVYERATYNGNTYSVADNYIFGTVLNDIAEADKVYVYTFCRTTDGKTYYSAPVEVNLK